MARGRRRRVEKSSLPGFLAARADEIRVQSDTSRVSGETVARTLKPCRRRHRLPGRRSIVHPGKRSRPTDSKIAGRRHGPRSFQGSNAPQRERRILVDAEQQGVSHPRPGFGKGERYPGWDWSIVPPGGCHRRIASRWPDRPHDPIETATCDRQSPDRKTIAATVRQLPDRACSRKVVDPDIGILRFVHLDGQSLAVGRDSRKAV